MHSVAEVPMPNLDELIPLPLPDVESTPLPLADQATSDQVQGSLPPADQARDDQAKGSTAGNEFSQGSMVAVGASNQDMEFRSSHLIQNTIPEPAPECPAVVTVKKEPTCSQEMTKIAAWWQQEIKIKREKGIDDGGRYLGFLHLDWENLCEFG